MQISICVCSPVQLRERHAAWRSGQVFVQAYITVFGGDGNGSSSHGVDVKRVGRSVKTW
jgi:hypothetical protein